MENEISKETKKKVGKGAIMAKIGLVLLGGWWMFKTFAKKDHTHDFMSAGASRGGIGPGKVLYITDENETEYLTYAEEYRYPANNQLDEKESYDRYGARLMIEDDVTAVVFQTTKKWSVAEMVPANGGYDDMRVVVAGNVQLRIPNFANKDYCFFSHIYADQINNNGGAMSFTGGDGNGCEVALFRKVWWFIV